MSPTFHLQRAWSYIEPAGVSVYTEFTSELVEKVINEQSANPQLKTLIILDDLGEDVHHSEGKASFNRLICNSRHHNTSILWLAQKLTQVPTFARSQTDCFISFNSLSTRERDALYNEVGTTDKKAFAKMFRDATKEQYGTFTATFKDGQLTYWKNLTVLIKNEV